MITIIFLVILYVIYIYTIISKPTESVPEKRNRSTINASEFSLIIGAAVHYSTFGNESSSYLGWSGF